MQGVIQRHITDLYHSVLTDMLANLKANDKDFLEKETNQNLLKAKQSLLEFKSHFDEYYAESFGGGATWARQKAQEVIPAPEKAIVCDRAQEKSVEKPGNKSQEKIEERTEQKFEIIAPIPAQEILKQENSEEQSSDPASQIDSQTDYKNVKQSTLSTALTQPSIISNASNKQCAQTTTNKHIPCTSILFPSTLSQSQAPFIVNGGGSLFGNPTVNLTPANNLTPVNNLTQAKKLFPNVTINNGGGSLFGNPTVNVTPASNLSFQKLFPALTDSVDTTSFGASSKNSSFSQDNSGLFSKSSKSLFVNPETLEQPVIMQLNKLTISPFSKPKPIQGVQQLNLGLNQPKPPATSAEIFAMLNQMQATNPAGEEIGDQEQWSSDNDQEQVLEQGQDQQPESQDEQVYSDEDTSVLVTCYSQSQAEQQLDVASLFLQTIGKFVATQLDPVAIENFKDTIKCYYPCNYFHVGPRYALLGFLGELASKVQRRYAENQVANPRMMELGSKVVQFMSPDKILNIQQIRGSYDSSNYFHVGPRRTVLEYMRTIIQLVESS